MNHREGYTQRCILPKVKNRRVDALLPVFEGHSVLRSRFVLCSNLLPITSSMLPIYILLHSYLYEWSFVV